MHLNTGRREALIGFGLGIVASGLARSGSADSASEATFEPANAKPLRELSRVLAGIPRRRDFQSVPMILDNPDLWDQAALATVLGYKGGPKQAWDNTDLAGPWLNGMRNALNSQIWSFREPNFLCVSATHGTAHLALFDQSMWDKYQLAKLAGGNITGNTFIGLPSAAAHDPARRPVRGGRVFIQGQRHRGPAAARGRVHGLPQCDLGGGRKARRRRTES
jgi:hypothetical protein